MTGFEGGNPLNVVINHQLKLPLHYVLGVCPLYETNGQLVDHDIDMESEKIFNYILDVSCKTVVQNKKLQIMSDRKSMHLESLERVPSLGKTFEHYLQKHLKYNNLNPAHLRLIHWHLANIEFSSANRLERLSLYHWDQDDPYGFGPFLFKDSL